MKSDRTRDIPDVTDVEYTHANQRKVNLVTHEYVGT